MLDISIPTDVVTFKSDNDLWLEVYAAVSCGSPNCKHV